MDWLFNLPVLGMTLVVLAAVYAATAAIYLLVTHLAVGDRARVFKAVSPGMLPPLAIIFALLVGFLAAQVWSDADRAGTAVNREASALRAAVLLAGQFPGEPETRLRDLIRRHIQTAATEEWPAMARRNVTLTIVPASLAEALQLTLGLEPHSAGQAIAQRELVASLQNALEARRQRIVLSGSSVNAVKWGALLVQAALILLTIAMVHSDSPATNRIILGVFATGVAAAIVLIAAHSRPFSGAIAVRPGCCSRSCPKRGPEAPAASADGPAESRRRGYHTGGPGLEVGSRKQCPVLFSLTMAGPQAVRSYGSVAQLDRALASGVDEAAADSAK